VALFKAQLNAAGFRRGEIVDVDPDEYARLIEKGWLKPHVEGVVMPVEDTGYVEPGDITTEEAIAEIENTLAIIDAVAGPAEDAPVADPEAAE